MADLLTYKETAARLGVGIATVKRYALTGRLPVVRLSAKTVRVDSDRLESMLVSLVRGGIPAPTADDRTGRA